MQILEESIYVRFNDIGCGECFRIQRDNPNIYMKVVLNNGDETLVNVANGCECEIDDLDRFEVIPVTAKVHIK